MEEYPTNVTATHPSDWFWGVIESARSIETEMNSATPAALQSVLEKMSRKEIRQFMHEFYAALIMSFDYKLWGAGCAASEGMSDDGFHYFRSWIIGCGKQAYELSFSNADELAELMTPEGYPDNELLEYVALDFLDDDDPRDDFDEYADGDPRGEPFDEAKLATLYPKLSALNL